MRKYLFAILIGLFGVTAAHADLVYNLTLTSTVSGAQVGTGSFTINTAPSTATGVVSDYNPPGSHTPGDILESVSFNFTDPQGLTYSFSLANGDRALDLYSVTFVGGVLTNVGYSSSRGGRVFAYTFTTGRLGYSYSFFNQPGAGFPTIYSDTGVLSLSTSPTAAPEPEGLVLVGTGVLAAAGVLLSRKRMLLRTA